MRLIRWKKRPQPEDLVRGTNPFSIWLHSHVELRIEKGDTILQVATKVQKYWPKVTELEARHIVAFWFAMGERLARHKAYVGPWEGRETDSSPERRYRPNTPRR